MVSAGMVSAEASKGMGPDEESFNVTVPVTQKVRTFSLQPFWTKVLVLEIYSLSRSPVPFSMLSSPTLGNLG